MHIVKAEATTFIIALLLIGTLFASLPAQADSEPETTSIPMSANAAQIPKKVSPMGTDSGGLSVEFSDKEKAVVIIVVGGKKYRIDAENNTVTEIAYTADTKSSVPAPKDDEELADRMEEQDDEEPESLYYYERGDEPFDYRVVNVPTPKSVPRGSWNLSFSHRFTQPIHPISNSAETLLGFDSFSVSSFSVTYGITDKLYITAARSPVCQRGLCRTIEVGAGYNILDEAKEGPVGLSVYGSLEGDQNFSRDYTLNFQTMVSKRVGKRIFMFFSPAVHINSNGNRRFDPRPEDFFPPAPIADNFSLPKHTASFGFGTTVSITPTVLALFDFTPRVGFKLGRVTPIFDEQFNIIDFENTSHPTIGIGIQKNIGNHSFSLVLSNSQTTTTSRYNSSNLVYSPKKLVFGFNLFRRF